MNQETNHRDAETQSGEVQQIQQIQRDSASLQLACLQYRGFRPDALWKAEDTIIKWKCIAAIGWVGFVLTLIMMNSFLKEMKHERGIKTSERPGGDGVVSVRVRGDVAADDAALRSDPVQVPSAGVVVASEEERAAGGVSTSGNQPGHFAGVGECGLNLMQGTRVVAETHNLVFAGATPAPAPNLPSGWNATGGRDAGMEAGTGVAVAGVAAAPIPKRGGMHS